MDPMSGCKIRLVFTYRPETVLSSTKVAYTFEIIFFALHLCNRGYMVHTEEGKAWLA